MRCVLWYAPNSQESRTENCRVCPLSPPLPFLAPVTLRYFSLPRRALPEAAFTPVVEVRVHPSPTCQSRQPPSVLELQVAGSQGGMVTAGWPVPQAGAAVISVTSREVRKWLSLQAVAKYFWFVSGISVNRVRASIWREKLHSDPCRNSSSKQGRFIPPGILCVGKLR